MKKYLTLSLLILLFSCKKEIKENNSELTEGKKNKTITLDQAFSLIRAKGANGIPAVRNWGDFTTTDIPYPNTGGCVSNSEGPEGFPFRTHGFADYGYNTERLMLHTKNDDGEITGSGVAVRFPFKRGRSYTVYFYRYNEAKTLIGDSQSQFRTPILQMQVTNTAPKGTGNCDDDIHHLPVTLTGPDPVYPIPSSIGANNWSPAKVFVNVDKCYDLLRFSAQPDISGRSSGIVHIDYITIFESEDIHVDGPNLDGVNSEADFNVVLDDAVISDNFTWTVSGGLQIVGSNIGSSVRIRKTSTAGGVVSISSGGCGSLATRDL